MKALVKYGQKPEEMGIREIPKPEAGPNDVVIKVMACGVDKGGDLYVWKSLEAMRFKVPVVVGAENCGEVVEVGEDVTMWKPGDRVVSEVVLGGCGNCNACLEGDYLHCDQRLDLGRWVDGAFAEYFKVNEKFVHKIPDNVSYKEAVLAEMAAVSARNLVEVTNIKPGDDVAIVGPGPIGLLSLQIAAASGARTVSVFGLSSDAARLELSKELGASKTYKIDTNNAGNTWKQDFPNLFDVVVDSTGYPDAVKLCLSLTKRHGTVAGIGVPLGKDTPVNWSDIVLKNLTIKGTYAHKWSTWETVLSMMEKRQLTTEKLVTKTYPLDEWEKAFKEVDQSKDIIKVAITPNGDI